MAMHDNIKLPKDGSKVDLYAETGVVRATEIRWQNIGGSSIYSHSDSVALAATDETRYKKLAPGAQDRSVGDQFVQVWSDHGGYISVESV